MTLLEGINDITAATDGQAAAPARHADRRVSPDHRVAHVQLVRVTAAR